MTLDRAAVARLIDHTLLKPEATPADVAALCKEANELGVLAVCVSPSMLAALHRLARRRRRTACGRRVSLRRAPGRCQGGGSGRSGHERRRRGRHGDRSRSRQEWRLDSVQDEIVAVREAAPAPCLLKVIIESALLDDAEIVAACQAAEAAGADFVKTSTGFHPSGGRELAGRAPDARHRRRPPRRQGVRRHPHRRNRAGHDRRRRQPPRHLVERRHPRRPMSYSALSRSRKRTV